MLVTPQMTVRRESPERVATLSGGGLGKRQKNIVRAGGWEEEPFISVVTED